MSNYYDRKGKPISLERWCELFEDRAYKIVARDEVGDYRVSTVWLGLDHGFSFDENHPPVIFESMVFKDGTGDEQWRYSTETEALEGHRRLVAEVRLLEEAAS